MNFKFLRLLISFLIVLIFLNGCADGQFANKTFKHDTPLIKKIAKISKNKITRIGYIKKNLNKSSVLNGLNTKITLKNKGYFHRF